MPLLMTIRRMKINTEKQMTKTKNITPKIYQKDLNWMHNEIITTYVNSYMVRIQTIKHLNRVIDCCKNCFGNITLEDLNTRKKEITYFCHSCGQDQYIKYTITKTSTR